MSKLLFLLTVMLGATLPAPLRAAELSGALTETAQAEYDVARSHPGGTCPTGQHPAGYCLNLDDIVKAHSGDPAAQWATAQVYKLGAGTAQNKAKYLEWLDRAAAGGFPAAVTEMKGINAEFEIQKKKAFDDLCTAAAIADKASAMTALFSGADLDDIIDGKSALRIAAEHGQVEFIFWALGIDKENPTPNRTYRQEHIPKIAELLESHPWLADQSIARQSSRAELMKLDEDLARRLAFVAIATREHRQKN